ncbi:DNA/RNA helicase domain-containing protein [Nonomuraea phyllanthi]|uniref:DNA/RNA helicase domain-containing protein n=1 Tax=Nonomuraea phyllanthi TaxID=2219224 RepID=UPI00186B3B53|nr:DNA/RNA helicase domain-containing protein [Nonomuraea phyllanthi]
MEYKLPLTSERVDGLSDQVLDERSRLFTKQRRGEFLRYSGERLTEKPGADAADRLLHSAVTPSKQLMTCTSKEIRDREQFTVLDEQQVVYEMVMRTVDRARSADSKQVVIVTGGPGSGKSVIALSLLGEVFRQGHSALHATGSQSFTQTMRRYPRPRQHPDQEPLWYFSSFTDAEPNGLDVLICDEAHRIRETSTNCFTPRPNGPLAPSSTNCCPRRASPVCKHTSWCRGGDMRGMIKQAT